MIRKFLALGLVILCAACADYSGRDKGVPVVSRPGKPGGPETKPAPADSVTGTWMVKTKACGQTALTVTRSERLVIANGHLTHVGLDSEDQTKECYLFRDHLRVVQSFSREGAVYRETSSLKPAALRTACVAKSGGAVLSDHTTPWEASVRKIALNVTGDTAIAKLVDEDCPSAPLVLELTRNKNAPRTVVNPPPADEP